MSRIADRTCQPNICRNSPTRRYSAMLVAFARTNA
jgi:hypothetical protein